MDVWWYIRLVSVVVMIGAGIITLRFVVMLRLMKIHERLKDKVVFDPWRKAIDAHDRNGIEYRRNLCDDTSLLKVSDFKDFWLRELRRQIALMRFQEEVDRGGITVTQVYPSKGGKQ